ncbi:MAG: DUF5681 domain-containing protein [Porticoccaceae bacterium]
MVAGFKPGVSGNPKGRPPGIPNRITKLREKLSRELPSILARVVKAAEDGDMAAARLILERTIPTIRPESLPVRLPGKPGDSLGKRAVAVVDAVAAARMAPDTGAALLVALANAAKAIEVKDLGDRLAALEARNDT